MARVVAIIQARMGSERLPGKVLREVKGRPLLWYLARQLSWCRSLDEVAVATSDRPPDEAIERFARKEGLRVFRGSERDVLDRYRRAADAFDADYVVRVTADCPLLCPTAVDRTATNHFESGCDYTMNDVPAALPRGYDVEIFSREVLERIDRAARRPAEREHVTVYAYTHPEEFSVNVFRDEEFPRFPTGRLCVDTAEDFEAVKRVIENIYEEGRYMHHLQVFRFLMEHPDVAGINAAVRQKAVDVEERKR
jgi:spore coat polysaccharide biosynthesis protein SpsF